MNFFIVVNWIILELLFSCGKYLHIFGMYDMPKKGKFEEQIRTKIKRLGMAYRAEQSYEGWYKRYVKFHDLVHPSEAEVDGVEKFLNHLGVNKEVAPGIQDQAFNITSNHSEHL